MGVFGVDPQLEPDPSTVRLCKLTRLAYEALAQEELALALERYHEVLAEFPKDTVALELVRRLAAMSSARRVQRQASD
jgi:adenylate cyclase